MVTQMIKITSLTSNPLNPQIIASTSCDKTTRLWSLDLPSSMIMEADDPEAAGRGPPFGSPMTGGEAEALGIGKCFAIFIGGFTTSGHKAAVMDAHFHPVLNLCVTSSVDHSIKIWEYPPPPQPDASKATLINITRPVFGTNMIHAAAVICIHWLSPSILISQSQESEVTHFTDATSREVTETERLTFPSKIVVWEWLGYETYQKAVTRGQFYVKDYFNAAQSRSYKVLAETHVGHTGKKLTFWGLTAVLTTKARIRIIDPTRLFLGRRPHTERPFKLDDLYTNDHDQWEEVLKMWKKDLWKQSEELESQIGIATVSVTSSDKENIFSAALYRNILLRVGQYEQMTLWKAVPKDAAV
ncbi:hypothetical protein CPB86DRAFT_772878 [Serendipita vermifera]|nr:hypothetical protein CPB86DRAFT_772878 [Serendipita vermifera]